MDTKDGALLLSEVGQKISQEMVRYGYTKYRGTSFAVGPIVLDYELHRKIERVAEQMVVSCTKGLKVLALHEDFKNWTKYSQTDKDVIKHAMDVDALTPTIARVDLTVVGDKIQVFELNADSPGGVLHLDLVSQKMAEVLSSAKATDWIDFKPTNVSNNIIDALIHKLPENKKNASIVILEKDPKNWPTWPEMKYIRDKLMRLGHKAEIIDMGCQQLEFDGSTLRVEGQSEPVDLIYKRILWPDMKKASQASASALAAAFARDKVLVVNSMGARFTGNKLLFALLRSPELQSIARKVGIEFDPDEVALLNSVIPSTLVWGNIPGDVWQQADTQKNQVLMKPYRWVLKSSHGYGGKQVLIGSDLEMAQTEFEKHWNSSEDIYIAQAHAAHGRERIPTVDGNKINWHHASFIIGAYVVDGKCVALEAKSASALPINMANNAVRTVIVSTRHQ